jgi:alcohol dehydrogenase
MDTFSFSIPQNVIFGWGAMEKISEIAQDLGGKKGFIISGPHLKKIGMVDKCIEALGKNGISCDSFTDTEGNPSTDTVDKATKKFCESGADFIIAFGGGSPLDTAKAVAVLGTFGGAITDYEGIGKVPGQVVPMIAIPTTAGTGSEVTSFSVITDHSRNYKLTVGSEYLLPKAAILDPELITSVPEKVAASCGVDAFVHALESYLSLAASPFSDMMALKAMELIGKYLHVYIKDRKDKTAAESMLMGSLFAGIAFSHARLGNVHAMSHPVSAFFDVPHGLANAVLLPTVVEYNEETDPEKYYDIYCCISRDPVSKKDFEPHMLVEEIRAMNSKLGIPADLKSVGVTADKLEAMTDDAMKSGNVKVNPRPTSREDILNLYKMTLGDGVSGPFLQK